MAIILLSSPWYVGLVSMQTDVLGWIDAFLIMQQKIWNCTLFIKMCMVQCSMLQQNPIITF